MSSPPENESKIDVAGRKGSPPDGVIRAIEISRKRATLSTEVKGILWVLSVSRTTELVDNKKILFVTFVMDCKVDQQTPWSMVVYAEFTFVHATDSSRNLTDGDHLHYSSGDASLAVHLLDRKDLDMGFLEDGKFTMEVRFWIVNMRGIRTAPRVDFTNADDPVHDMALVIDGEKIYVSKQLLAVHSPVFKAMFFGDFAEKNQKEIELTDVDREEFVEMLRVIYPSAKKITDASAAYLLKLGDRFQMQYVMDRVEEFLIAFSAVDYLMKLRLADHYRLEGLQVYCFSKMKTKKHFKSVLESPIYGALSDGIKAALFEQVMQMDE